MTFLSDVRVRAGYDLNPLSTSYRVTAYTPSSGSTFRIAGFGDVYVVVDSVPEYSRGEERFDANGAVSYAGRKQITYVSETVHRDTVDSIITNLEGQVTAYLTDYGTTYAYYNCLLRFRVESSTLNINKEWLKLIWIFSIVEEL